MSQPHHGPRRSIARPAGCRRYPRLLSVQPRGAGPAEARPRILGYRPRLRAGTALDPLSPAVTTHLAAGHDSVPSPPTPEKVRALLGRLTRIAAAPKTEPARNAGPGRQEQAIPANAAALQQAERQGYQRGFKEGEAAGRVAASHFYNFEIARVADALKHLQDTGQPKAASGPEVTPPKSAPPARPKIVGNGATAPSGHVPIAAAMQLLTTAVTHWPVRFTWGQLATLNGRKARGGHFNASKKFLVDNGFATERDGKVEPTDAAFEKIGVPRKEMPATRDKMLALWLAALPSPAKDMLQPLHRTEAQSRLTLLPRASTWLRAGDTGISACTCFAAMILSAPRRRASSSARLFPEIDE